MTSTLWGELAATCSALGYFDAKSNRYYAHGNTLETIKDIIRFLRRDDDNHDVRRQLGEAKVLQADLLPLLSNYWGETDIFDILLRLMVNLTTPTLILWHDEIPTEKAVRNHYLQVEDHLQQYKEAFADEAIWAVFGTRLSQILEIPYAERGDENSLIIERILLLIRNILYVPADTMENRPDNDASIHDQVLWALHQSGMLDIILYMTSSADEHAYFMHILEILTYMLREQKASELADAKLQRSQTEKIRDEAQLVAVKHGENNQKQTAAKIYTSARHSKFGGAFVVKSLKSISDNELIYHKPLNKLDVLNFDADKKKKKTPKNRLPVMNGSTERRSAFTIRLFLKEFCVEFLNGAYNILMRYVKDVLVRAKAQAHDESYYLWALRFFMEFNRRHKFEVKLVCETMSVQAFHYVQQQSENYFDLMQTDKKKLRLWSRRLHLALLAYRELLLTLCAMDKSHDGTVRDSSKVIKSNVFYVPEYREFILALLVTYDELKLSDAYLKDLIETQHIFLAMFEAFCGEEGSLIVRKKAKGKKRKNKKAVRPVETADLNLEGRWDEAAPQLSIVLEGGTDPAADAVPFDAASDVPIDDQKAEAMKKVQRGLRSGEFEAAVSLLRASREVWPENDSFGSNNMTPEEEFLALRDIFFADLGENEARPVQEHPENDLVEEVSDEYDEEEEGPQYLEGDYKFEDFAKRLPHPKIVRACGLALRSFETNSVSTNHCIVKLLHRIAFDCKMYVILFQLSIFRTFQRIFVAKDLPQYKELVKFATYIVRQFFKVAETNKTVFLEAVFWKSSKDAYDIEHGYGSYQEASRVAGTWSEQEEDELRRLFMEHQQNNIEEDVVDWIVNNLIDNTRTRRGILKKLKEMCLLVDYKGKKKSGVKTKIPQSWGAEEETQLLELYEQFKDAIDPLGCIMPRLEISRPKNRIIEKMLVMGLIQDRKEVRKKRVRAGKSKPQQSSEDDGGSNSDSDDNSDFPHNAPASFAAAVPRRPNKNSATSRKKSSKNKNRRVEVRVPKSQLVRLLLNNVQSGRDEALEWLKESLSDAIEDFEDGDVIEGIPLVPVMDYAQAAMDDGEFQRMLKAFCICEPFDEQEAYWRIPCHLTVDNLRNYCNLIQEALDKTLTVPENDSEPVSEDKDESDDDDVFPDIAQNVAELSDDSTSSQNDVFEKLRKSAPIRPNIQKPLKKRKNYGSNKCLDMIEVDSDVASTYSDAENGFGEVTGLSKRNGRYVIDSESDNEVVEDGLIVRAMIHDNESKRIRSSDSDSERPVTKRGRIIDSDDEMVPV